MQQAALLTWGTSAANISGMNSFKTIRDRLGMTQAALAESLGCTQGNVGHYEKGQTVPPAVAKKLIEVGARRKTKITYEEIYGHPDLTRSSRSKRSKGQDSQAGQGA